MTTRASTDPLKDFELLKKRVHLMETHFNAGHGLEDPRVRKDLPNLILYARRVQDRLEIPPDEREQLSYIVRNMVTHEQLENAMSQVSDDIKAAAVSTGEASTAAANRVIEFVNTQNTTLREAQEALAAAETKIIDLQAQIDTGTVDPASAQEILDVLTAARDKLADLDSDPLTPI